MLVALLKIDPRLNDFLYFARGALPGDSNVYVGSLDSKETRLRVSAPSGAAYAPPGYLLYVREETLMAHRFDADRLELTGEARAQASMRRVCTDAGACPGPRMS
jgi:hypothetical protein